MALIPDSVFTTYKQFADDFISDNFGVNCKLVYPEKRIVCANCVTSPMPGASKNVYRNGGPAPFSFGLCPMCGGEGYSSEETTETIKMRVYFNPKDWVKVANVNTENAMAQTIGFIYDMPKIARANYVILNSDQDGYKEWKFSLLREPLPHGFKRDRYFVAYWQRS